MGLFGNLFKNDAADTAAKVETRNVNDEIETFLSKAEESLKLGTVNGYDEAIEWFSKAEELGSDYAAVKAAHSCAIIAEFCLKRGICNEETFDYWKKTAFHGMNAIEDPNTKYFDSAMELMKIGIIGMAYVQYIANQNIEALETLKNLGETKRDDAILLKALCLYVMADEYVPKCGGIFEQYLTDENYLSGISGKGIIEQTLIALATANYCSLINKGLVNGKNSQSAKAIFERVYNSLTYDIAKNPLNAYLENQKQ